MTDIRWPMWRALPHVELWQAVLLSLRKEPTAEAFLGLATSDRASMRDAREFRRSRGYSAFEEPPPDYWDRLSSCQAGLSASGPIRPQGPLYSGMLDNPRCPVMMGDVVAFLALAGFTVPDEMLGIAPTAAKPRALPVASDSADVEWSELAIDDARRIIKRQAARGLYPSQVDIADEIAADFRKRHIFGTGGKPLTGATIKRQALKGISSASKRAQSTAPKRGE